jgi:hypothetical protein
MSTTSLQKNSGMKNSNLICIENAFGQCVNEMFVELNKKPLKEQMKLLRFIRQQIKKYGSEENKKTFLGNNKPAKKASSGSKRKPITNLWAPRK